MILKLIAIVGLLSLSLCDVPPGEPTPSPAPPPGPQPSALVR